MKPAFLCPYLAFDGDCRQAMEFYQSCMGGKLAMQTFGESGQSKDEKTKDRIMHAALENDDLTIMASDAMPGMPFIKGTNVSLSVVGNDMERIKGYYEKLGVGGTVTMKMEKQFWGDVFGMLTDKFGMHWMFNVTERKA